MHFWRQFWMRMPKMFLTKIIGSINGTYSFSHGAWFEAIFDLFFHLKPITEWPIEAQQSLLVVPKNMFSKYLHLQFDPEVFHICSGFSLFVNFNLHVDLSVFLPDEVLHLIEWYNFHQLKNL